MDLAGWLRSLGLELYEAAFRENAIDDAVLPDLTEDHLREMGIPLGARIKLLKAIAALNERTETILPTSIGSAAPPVEGAERRQLTVMFCDLVGSTALAASMDPEDLREVISGYQKRVAETVRRFDGFVAKYMGDGALVYFGYPQAHEDDAERAVRAGLELIAAVARLNAPTSLQTRVGIATGLVVVGDLIGSGEAQERGIVGETPNLAARLQGIAEPDKVVIADSTRRLLGNLFDLEDLGARDLKGIADPVRAWAALRPSSVEGRFEAFHATGLTTLVGREEESELLLRRWSKAKTGEGQVVLLTGEAGIGKSRLTAALLERLATEPHTRLRYFCSPQHTGSAFYPIIGQMERAAGLAHNDTPKARLDKLDALLAQTSTSIEDAALFAEMLSLSNDGRYPAFDLAPQQRRQRTLEALNLQLEVLTRTNPILMIFEDAHWTDPTSLEVFGRVVNRIAALRVLLIVTFRPEFEPPWIGRPHVTSLTINRLAQRDVDTMINRVVGNKLLPASIRQDIIERTDGIPLFVEEMTKAVLEAESEGEARRTAAAVPSSAPAVPASLHASLMARLDRLGSAKEVAQVGAAVGREFSHALLASVMGQAEPELRSALDRLIAAGLLFRQGEPPHASYLFKHALVQDTAHGTLLREPRRALHARIAEAIESQFPEITDSQPELLARHCTEAGLVEKAVTYWLKAGRLAGARSANVESASHLNKALVLLGERPRSEARDRRELEVRVALGPALTATKSYGADETIENYERCRDLIRLTGDQAHWQVVLTGLFVTLYQRCAYRQILEIAHEFLQKAEDQHSAVALCVGHRLLSGVSNILGDFRTSVTNGKIAFRLYDRDQHPQLAWQYVHDLGVAAASQWAIAAWHQGMIDTAKAAREEAFGIAARLNHHNTTAYALYYSGVLPAFFRRDFEALAEYAARLLEHASRHGFPQWTAWTSPLAGAAQAYAGRVDDGVVAIERGIALCDNIKNESMRPVFLSGLAEAQLMAGRHQDAASTLDTAFSIGDRTGEQWMTAELWRLRAALASIKDARGAGGTPNAEYCLQRGIRVAKSQGARTFALRLITSLARLRADERPEQACLLLTSALKPFRDGFDTVDVKEAKALLDVLA